MKRALLIANQVFNDARISSLRSPVTDAAELGKVLRNPELGGFEVLEIMDGSARDIQMECQRFFEDTGPTDTILIHVSGHGERGRHGFLYVPMDADLRWLDATCVRGSYFRDLLRATQASRQIVIIDCCFSGSIIDDLMSKGTSGSEIADLLDAEGVVVITASNAAQEAFELGNADGGSTSAFTRAIVDGILTGDADLDHDGYVTMRELYKYARERVVGYGQSPTMSERSVEGDVIISRAPNSPSPLVRIPAEILAALDSPTCHCVSPPSTNSVPFLTVRWANVHLR